ncbi:MAG: flagellar basal body rod protein FlgB [Vampirovibrionales bacterium]
MMQLMGLNLNDSLGQLSNTLGGLTMVQKIVANNIANANTPGYTAQKADFASVMGLASHPMETSLSVRMGNQTLQKLMVEGSPTGQKVNLQEEMVTMQKNLLFFSIATRRLATTITNLKASGNIGR